MTHEEVQKIMQMLAAAYPNFYKDKTAETKTLALEIWAVALSDFPYGFIMAGIKKLVQTKTFPPTVAEVIQSAKDSALDRLTASTYLKYGDEVPADRWVMDSRNRPVQFGEWSEERKRLAEGEGGAKCLN